MRLRQREESTFLQIWVWVKARDNYPSNCTIDYKLVGDWILSAGSQTKIFTDCTMYNNLSRDEDHVHTGRGGAAGGQTISLRLGLIGRSLLKLVSRVVSVIGTIGFRRADPKK